MRKIISLEGVYRFCSNITEKAVTVGHPTSFPSLSTRQLASQYEFSSVCTQQSGKYHRPYRFIDIFWYTILQHKNVIHGMINVT